MENLPKTVSQCKTTPTTISNCLTALVELSEVAEEDLTPPECSRPNDGLSPWDPTVLSRSTDSPRPLPRSAKRDQCTALPCRPHTTPGSLNHDPDRSRRLMQKTLKFRGLLHTLLCSERQQLKEPGFQHLEDTRDYIHHYRQLRHPASAVKTVDGDKDDAVPEAQSYEKYQSKSSALKMGTMPKRCSRAQRGCPHYVPRSPCTKTDRQRELSSPVGAVVSSVKATPISVRGSNIGQHNERGQRVQRRFHISKDRRMIIAETQSCKHIRLTWRQYLKYFSKPSSEHKGNKHDEKDSKRGYAERPATPCSDPIHPRAATCVPVLDYDQSRVGTPASLFPCDQSAKRKQLQSGSCCGNQEHDDNTPENGISPLHQPVSEKQKVTCRSLTTYGTSRHLSRPAICTVMDIQEAIRKLQISLGVRRPSCVCDMCV